MCILKAQELQTFPPEQASESWLGDHNQILSARDGLYLVTQCCSPPIKIKGHTIHGIYLFSHLGKKSQDSNCNKSSELPSCRWLDILSVQYCTS